MRLIALLVLVLLTAASALGQTPASRSVPVLVKIDHVFVQATISGKKALLIVDTGATTSAFKLAFVPKHDKLDETGVRTANSVSVNPQVITDVGIENCGSVKINALYGDFNFGVADGLLGMDILGKYSSITLDLKNQRLILID